MKKITTNLESNEYPISGLAHSLSNGFDDAIVHFKNAVEILENRIKNLQSSSASEDETVKKNLSVDPFYTIESEIKELTELLPEIREKIQDTIDYKAEVSKCDCGEKVRKILDKLAITASSKRLINSL